LQSPDRISLLSSNKQIRLVTTKSVNPGFTVSVENISPDTSADTLKRMGLGLGLKVSLSPPDDGVYCFTDWGFVFQKIIMKQAGSQQAAHMIFSSREGADKFVNMNQRKVVDFSEINLRVL
jgi:hypothetical protein